MLPTLLEKSPTIYPSPPFLNLIAPERSLCLSFVDAPYIREHQRNRLCAVCLLLQRVYAASETASKGSTERQAALFASLEPPGLRPLSLFPPAGQNTLVQLKLYFSSRLGRKDTVMATTFTKFAQNVISEMSRQLEGFELTEQSIIKMNDITLHGITARRKGCDSAPTVYLDSAYDDYCNGASLDSIINSFVDTVLNAEPMTPIKTTAELDMHFDSIKDKLTARLIDTELNQMYLQRHPYGYVGAGLALIAEINLGNGYRCVITNDIVKQYDLEISEVLTTAIENMEKRYPATLMSLESAIFGGTDNVLDGNGYIDTMGTLMIDGADGFGATAIAYKGMGDRIRELIGDYYILPSSLHELIVLRDNGTYDTAELKNMVMSANSSVVDESDRLSDSVFHFGAEGLRRIA